MTIVNFFENEIKSNLKNKKELKDFIRFILNSEKKDASNLNFIFCNDDYLLEINRKHLQHDFYTDIITFDLSERKGEIIGEIYISIERVIENAHSLKTKYIAELHRVIFHGVLHLCGYKDKSKSDTKKMRNAEDVYLKHYFN